MQDILLPSEIKLINSWEHRPLCAGQVLSNVIARAVPNSQLCAAMQEQLSLYISLVGTCERILKTCLPMCYTRHLSRKFVLLNCACDSLKRSC